MVERSIRNRAYGRWGDGEMNALVEAWQPVYNDAVLEKLTHGCWRGENCIFRTLNIALCSFSISNIDFVKMGL